MSIGPTLLAWSGRAAVVVPYVERIAVLGVEWSPGDRRDLAIVRVDGAVYHLPLAEDRDAPTGHGGSSAATWWVDEELTTEADDDAIGERYDAIGELVTEHLTRSEAA